MKKKICHLYMNELNDSQDIKYVYDEFCPTENYMWCNGRKFIER